MCCEFAGGVAITGTPPSPRTSHTIGRHLNEQNTSKAETMKTETMKTDAIIPIRGGPPASISNREPSSHLGMLLGGAAVALYGLSRRSLAGALMASSGGALAYYAYRADSG